MRRWKLGPIRSVSLCPRHRLCAGWTTSPRSSSTSRTWSPVKLAAAEALDRFPTIHGLVLSTVAHVQGGPTVLQSGHELMFATNVMGPFLFTQLLVERMQQSNGLVLHVVAPFHRELDWEALESIRNHKTTAAYNRTKTCGRALAGELARRYAGTISSVAFDPAFIIDKSDPELRKRWPSGPLRRRTLSAAGPV